MRALKKREEELCRRLQMDPTYMAANLLPTALQLQDLKEHIKKLEETEADRLKEFTQMKGTILRLYEELELEPMTDVEREIACEDTNRFILSQRNMDQVTRVLSSLVEKVQANQKEIMECCEKIDVLYERLQLDMADKFKFLAANTGHSRSTVGKLREELARLEEMKRGNMEQFITNIRAELERLWDQCYYSQAQRAEFAAFQSSEYSEELLGEHEAEAERLRSYLVANRDLLAKVGQRQEVWHQFRDLERRAKDPTRLMNARGNALLLEEKERNRVNKMLPRLEQELHSLIAEWEAEHGQTFLVGGVNFMEYIAAQKEEHIQQLEQEKIQREQAKKKTLQTESRFGAQPSTPARLKLSSTSSSSAAKSTLKKQNFKHLTPGSCKILSRINTPRSPRLVKTATKEKKDESSSLRLKRRSSYGIKRGERKTARSDKKEKLKRGILTDLDDSIVQLRSCSPAAAGANNSPFLADNVDYAKFKNGNHLDSTEVGSEKSARNPHYLTPTRSAKNKLFKTPTTPYSRTQSRLKTTPSSGQKKLPLLL